jgi:predicted nucleic acid-binding protein
LNSYVVDGWAWIEYLIGSEYGSKVNEILENEGNEIYTCAVTLAEIVSKVAREGKDVEVAYSLLLNNSQIIDADEELSRCAGELHAEMRRKQKDFSLADSYVLATARKLESKILTGDMHFKNLAEAILLK